jgi:hypothetical protein
VLTWSYNPLFHPLSCPSLLLSHCHSFPIPSLSTSLIIPTIYSLIFLSYKGLMADSDSKSIHWTNDTNTWGRPITYSAPKAKLSMRPWPGASSSTPPGASLHRCTAVMMQELCTPWHLGASAWIWSSTSSFPTPPEALRTNTSSQ